MQDASTLYSMHAHKPGGARGWSAAGLHCWPRGGGCALSLVLPVPPLSSLRLPESLTVFSLSPTHNETHADKPDLMQSAHLLSNVHG